MKILSSWISLCCSVPANVTMPKKEAVHPAITRHHHHHRHCHRCHHLHHSGSCSHSAGSIGWCAGRFVQISIIILILVMSFWSVLYNYTFVLSTCSIKKFT